MQKVAVIGCAGAGKSSFSRRLSEMTGIPVYHLDKYYWNPNWIPTPDEAWHRFVHSLVSKESWIIDGNYQSTMDIRLEEADTVFFLDMPVILCLYRVIKRRISYRGRTRPDMNEGCPEKLDAGFIRWILPFNRKHRPGILAALGKYANSKDIYIMAKPSDIERFFAAPVLKP